MGRRITEANKQEKPNSRTAQTASAKSFASSKGPIFRFAIGFALLMGLFSVFFYGVLTDTRLFQWYLNVNASASALVLRLFGDDARATGDILQSVTTNASVQIRHGCDAILPAGLFVTAILAFPVALRLKWPGILLGTSILVSLNLVRIISLYLVRAHWPDWFHTMHVDVWQPAFIFFSLSFWILWALWATKPRSNQTVLSPHVSA